MFSHPKTRRLSMARPLKIAGIAALLSLVSWLVAGTCLYWNDPKLVNFLAAWIPFVLTVLIAYVPESNMTPLKKIAWRTAVIGAGFLFSAVLWHQQVITEKIDADNRTKLAGQANSHSDEQFGRVEKELNDAKADLGERIDKVPSLLTKTESDLNLSISKVGTLPEKHAQLQFEVFDSDPSKLITTTNLMPDSDGIYTLDFTATNISDISTGPTDIWVNICRQCTYAQEPTGFDEPKGIDEHARHKALPSLNPGVTFEKMTIKFKVSGRYTSTNILFTYSCPVCGKMGPSQVIRGDILPPLLKPRFN